MGRGHTRSAKYVGPAVTNEIGLSELLRYCGRAVDGKQDALFPNEKNADPTIYWAGSLELLKRPAVAVIGSRDVSAEGIARAKRISKLLSEQGVTIVSGLARGVDTAAHTGAITAGGSTVGVIGTPIDKAYPAENGQLQQDIYEHHLLLSQFPAGTRTYPSDFPKRNRTMASVTDASIIVEASDTSGSLHQAAECVRLGRWLFIMQSVVDNPRLEWPAKFLKQSKVAVLASAEDVIQRIA